MGSTQRSLSRRKRFLFGAVVLATPVLILAALEAGLRGVGFGESLPLFVPVPGFEEYLYQNRNVARRYFGDQASIPDAQADPFRREKRDGALRIFVQGGSSAAGFPYNYGIFSRMLEQRLLQSFDDREIEVVNTSLAAVNSWTLLDFAPEILAQKPDAILIYAGHNEYYGALGVGSTQSLGRSRALVRLRLRLRPLRTVQLVQHVVRRIAGLRSPSPSDPGQATLMERMVARKEIPYGSDLYESGLHQFRANIEELLSIYQRAGVPVFIATVASNERTHAPFAGKPAQDGNATAWSQLVQEAAGTTEADEAISLYRRSIALDSLAADAWFGLAQVLDSEGRYTEARQAYVAARDRDALRFRAPSALNAVIREVAAEHGATLVDAEAQMVHASHDGIIGSDLILEHLHPNIEGYFQIAEAFYDSLMKSKVLGPGGSRVPTSVARSEVLVTPVDSLFGEYRVEHLKSRWPFQPLGTTGDWVPPAPQSPVEKIAVDFYEHRISWYDAMIALSDYHVAQNDLDGALQPLMAAAQQFDFHPDPFGRIGSLLMQAHQYQQALRFLLASLERGESAEAHYMAGFIYSVQGDLQHTIEHLERGRKLGPPPTQALYRLAEAYVQLGRIPEAQVVLHELLQREPGDQQGKRLLQSLS